MNEVDAVTPDQCEQIHDWLTKHFPPIYPQIWKIGLNLSLRISDLLALRYSDINIPGKLIQINEKKTGKKKIIRINSIAAELIMSRRLEYPDDIWLFQVHSNRAKNKPIGRGEVARVFKQAGDHFKLHVSTHTMRKSRGAEMYRRGMPIELICKVLNHSNPSVTLGYLGITKEEILQTYDDVML
jgi:integrase